MHSTGMFVLGNESLYSVSGIFLTRKHSEHLHGILCFVNQVSGRSDRSIRWAKANGSCQRQDSPFASPSVMSFGALMKAAPGRPDSAARKAFATTSETELAESISALNFVTGRKRFTGYRGYLQADGCLGWI